MPPRNAGELARLEEERADLIKRLKHNKASIGESSILDWGYKTVRESMLRDLRKIEQTLGIESVPYNSTAFGEQDEEVD